MQKTKMAALFLVLLMALGATGFAAAWWNEELVITGEVTTGTFGWELTLEDWGVSGETKPIIDAFVWLSILPGGLLARDQPAKCLNFYAHDMYPCTDIWIVWDLHFYGSVPGHIYEVTVEAYENDVLLGAVPDYVDLGCIVFEASPDLIDQGLVEGRWPICDFLEALECTQWHESDYIVVVWELHLIETDMDPDVIPPGVEVPQDTTLEVTVTISGKQYNAP